MENLTTPDIDDFVATSASAPRTPNAVTAPSTSVSTAGFALVVEAQASPSRALPRERSSGVRAVRRLERWRRGVVPPGSESNDGHNRGGDSRVATTSNRDAGAIFAVRGEETTSGQREVVRIGRPRERALVLCHRNGTAASAPPGAVGCKRMLASGR